MAAASIRNNQLILLAGRTGYNTALRHFRSTQEFAADVGDGFNLADVLNAALQEGRIQSFQIRPVVHLLLVEKFGYSYRSYNLVKAFKELKELTAAVKSWTNIQIVLVYTDTNDIVHLLNPETPEDWEDVLPIARDGHVVCYAGFLNETRTEILESAVSDVFSLLEGRKIRAKSGYKSGGEITKQFLEEEAAEEEQQTEVSVIDSAEGSNAESQTPQSSGSSSGVSGKLTAKIAVNVTNELFHNGNVEAWKRIIESYKMKYPWLDVLIWYEGERINDINALFKWGKVKHGVPILFSVAGDNPKDISKLRKYLFEGASPRFEAFLHGAPGTVLHLF